MRVVLSVDMEGISQLVDPFEIFAFRGEYWRTGKARMEADTVAAAEGLLAAGADEVIVLDNHASGNRENVSAGCLPEGVRLETWNVFDLPGKGIDAMLQVGYHARGGVDGFISHTYVPGLRLRLAGELISESHGRAWAAEVPLIGIVGNDQHRTTLGSLQHTPYLVVQCSRGRNGADPVVADAGKGLEAIRGFARQALERLDRDAPCLPPAAPLFEACMPNAADHAEAMRAVGWRRAGDLGFAAELGHWSDARELLAAAMNAASAPLMPHWMGADSADAAGALDRSRVAGLSAIVDRWVSSSWPEWPTDAVAEIVAAGE